MAANVRGILSIPLPIRVDPRIKDDLIITTTTNEIEQNVGNCFSASFKILADQIEHEGLKKKQKCNCLITRNDEIIFYLDDTQLGAQFQCCYYPLHRWVNFNEIQMLTCILEELCHYFWSIEDELEVKYKVLEIIRRVIKDIELYNLYPEELIEQLKKVKQPLT